MHLQAQRRFGEVESPDLLTGYRCSLRILKRMGLKWGHAIKMVSSVELGVDLIRLTWLTRISATSVQSPCLFQHLYTHDAALTRRFLVF